MNSFVLLGTIRGRLRLLPKVGKTVTGQRSNQLNYVPSLFSYR
jgi:hypothetical protein